MPAHIAVPEITARAVGSAPTVSTYTQTTRAVAGIVGQGTTGRAAGSTRLPISTCTASAATCAFTAVQEIADKVVTSTQPACMNFSVNAVFSQRKSCETNTQSKHSHTLSRLPVRKIIDTPITIL